MILIKGETSLPIELCKGMELYGKGKCWMSISAFTQQV